MSCDGSVDWPGMMGFAGNGDGDLAEMPSVRGAGTSNIRFAAPSGATGGCTTALCFGSCMGERIGLGVRAMDAACMCAGRAAAGAGVAGVC